MLLVGRALIVVVGCHDPGLRGEGHLCVSAGLTDIS